MELPGLCVAEMHRAGWQPEPAAAGEMLVRGGFPSCGRTGPFRRATVDATTAAKVEQKALAQYGRVLSKSADERIDSRRYISTLATSGYLSGYWM